MPEPQLRWIAPNDTHLRLATLLKQLHVSGDHLANGNVRVNQRRADDAEYWLKADDVVEVFSARMHGERCRVVDQRGDLLIIEKPANLASEPTQQGQAGSVSQQLCELTGLTVHVLSRLDVGVGGLMLVSTSHAGNAHVERLRAQGQLHRHYLAIAAGVLPSAGRWQSSEHKSGKRVTSITRYTTLERVARTQQPHDLSLLLLQPETGRTHQLRSHCARALAPLVGDRRYKGICRIVLDNGTVVGQSRISLHAVRLQLQDMCGQPWCIHSEHPSELAELWELIGGTRSSLQIVMRSKP